MTCRTPTGTRVHSAAPEGNCVELAALPGEQIAMRNSRDPSGPVLIFTKAQLKDLIDLVKLGSFDDLCSAPTADGNFARAGRGAIGSDCATDRLEEP